MALVEMAPTCRESGGAGLWEKGVGRAGLGCWAGVFPMGWFGFWVSYHTSSILILTQLKPKEFK